MRTRLLPLYCSVVLALLLPPAAFSQAKVDWATAGTNTTAGYTRSSDLVRDAEGNVYVLGSGGGGSIDLSGDGVGDVPCSAFVVSYDAGGRYRWATPLVRRANASNQTVDCPIMTGSEATYAQALALDASGNLFVTGYWTNYDIQIIPTGEYYVAPNHYNSYLIQLTTDGTFVTSRRTRTTDRVILYDLVADERGHLYATGYIAGTADFDGNGTWDAASNVASRDHACRFFLAEYGPDLMLRRQIVLPGRQYSGCSVGYNLDVRSGKLAVAGAFQNEIYFGNTRLVNTNAPTANTLSHFYDGFVAQYDTTLAFGWARGLHGREHQHGVDVAFDADGNVYTGYWWQEEADLDGDSSVDYTAPHANENFYSSLLVKYDAAGAQQWKTLLHSTALTRVRDIDADDAGRVFLAGFTQVFSGSLNHGDLDGNGRPEYESFGPTERGFLGAYSAASGSLVWFASSSSSQQGAGSGTYSSRMVAVVAPGDGLPIVAGSFEGPLVDLDHDGQRDLTGNKHNSAGSLSDLFAVRYDPYISPQEGPSAAFHSRDGRGLIRVPDRPGLDVAGPLTLEAWYRRDPSPVSNYGAAFVWKGADDGANASSPYYLGVNSNGCMRGSIGHGGGPHSGAPTTCIPSGDDRWHHVALTADGTTVRLFVDGVEEDTAPQTGTPVDSPHRLQLGNWLKESGASACCFNLGGSIDQVRLWGRALSAEELRSKRFLRLRASDEAGIVGLWQFDRPHDPRVWDGSGNDYHGYLSTYADLQPSAAPIGAGAAAEADVSSETLTPLPETDLAVGLAGVDGSPRIQAVRLDQPPSGEQPQAVDHVIPATWIIENVGTGTFTSVHLRFTIDGLGEGMDTGAFRLFRRASGSAGAWTEVASAAASFDPATGAVRFDDVRCCSQYVIGVTGALPVELAALTAMRDGDAAILAWTTASETGNAGFEIQHRSPRAAGAAPGASAPWVALGFVEGGGTTAEARHYEHRVGPLGPGTHRFRLRQLDLDGTFAYSPEVEVVVELPGPYALGGAHPNPFTGEARVTLAVQASQHVLLTVYDALGRRVAVLHDGVIEAGASHAFVLDGSAMPSGVYLLRAEGEAFQAMRELVLVR